MENSVKALFERYEKLFRMALASEVDMDKVASSYAAAFVAASPAGVSIGQNDEHLKQVMEQGFENYRRIGRRTCDFVMSASHLSTGTTAWRTSLGPPSTTEAANRIFPLILRSITWCSSLKTRQRSSDGYRGMSKRF